MPHPGWTNEPGGRGNSMNASDLFIKALENEGVEVIYGVPGEENLDFLEALRKSSIKLILTRHEQGAAFMAATPIHCQFHIESDCYLDLFSLIILIF